MRLGIDLGTTFCCVALVGDDGWPRVLPNAEGHLLTPSRIAFDGRRACVGARADETAREQPGMELFTFVKRETGRPAVAEDGTRLFHIGGFTWGVEGIQALQLRKLKRDALAHLYEQGLVESADEDERVEAVITVPAHFKDSEREQTRRAGHAAGLRVVGLRVVGIVNEPTAAALTYLGSAALARSQLVFVFDYGGGTFDATILKLFPGGNAEVLATDGLRKLGGMDTTHRLAVHLRDALLRTKSGAPLSKPLLAELGALAEQAKLDLATHDEVHVARTWPEGTLDVMLVPGDLRDPQTMRRISQRCEDVRVEAAKRNFNEHGVPQPLEWSDLDAVILVGGSCRLWWVPDLVRKITGKTPTPPPPGFDLDTAVALGAARYGEQPDLVMDVTSCFIGVKLIDMNNEEYIEVLVPKNSRLPFRVEKKFLAPPDARLEIWHGDSGLRALSAGWKLRGVLELENPEEGWALVIIEVSREGELKASVTFTNQQATSNQQQMPSLPRELRIRNAQFDCALDELVERVQSVEMTC